MSTPTPTPTPADDDRVAWRRLLLDTRASLPRRAELDAALAAALARALALSPAACIGGYSAIRGEFDPLPVLLDLRRSRPALQLALPRVDAAARRMHFALWNDGATLVSGAYGIAEPEASAPRVEPDLLLLPCVGFAPSGLRLGYGGGYYDRYLQHHRGVDTIGLAYEACRIDALRAQPHDHLLRLILTERSRYGAAAPDALP